MKGLSVENQKFEDAWFELLQRFGSLTYEPAPRRGVWTHELGRFEDDLVRFILDLEDTDEKVEFMRQYKKP